MDHFGVSPYISVPVASVLLIAITATGSFRRWERFMYILIAVNFAAIPLAVLSHPRLGPVVHDSFVPGIHGGLNSTVLLLIIGIIGTTVAPWQPFFQQSNVIDKRLTPRWMGYERADTAIGAVVVIVGASALVIVAAFGFAHTPMAGHFTDGRTVAAGLTHSISPLAGDLFALVLLNASIIGAAAVTLSTSYAFGDVFGMKYSLHRTWRDAFGFYSIYAVLVLLAAGVVLIPQAPLGLITLGVQALAGVLLPSATVFLLLLCNDRAVLGPWVNKPWVNAVASVIVGVLVILSLILAATTLFPSLDSGKLLLILGIVLAAGLGVVGLINLRRSGDGAAPVVEEPVDRARWRMPPLASLSRPVWSRTRRIGMLTLRVYLVVAGLLMVFKVVQLALGHG
jgi:Mn2+/Fe2+ NRAMP family transporter